MNIPNMVGVEGSIIVPLVRVFKERFVNRPFANNQIHKTVVAKYGCSDPTRFRFTSIGQRWLGC